MVSAEPTPYGIENYEVQPENDAGAAERQAGGAPFQFTTTLAFNQTIVNYHEPPKILPSTPQLTRNLHVNLPAGLIGNPHTTPTCSELEFTTHPSGEINICPADAAVGAAIVRLDEPNSFGMSTVVVPVFNLAPAPGSPLASASRRSPCP